MLSALQAIEAAVRSATVRAALLLRGRGGAPPLPDWGAGPHRVLFIRDDRVGDMIASLAVMRAIATSHQTITLDVLASPRNASLIEGRPWVGRVLVHRRDAPLASWKMRRELSRAPYDAVIDGRVFIGSVNMHTTFTMLASGARWRIGLSGRRNGAVYNVPIDNVDRPHWFDYLVALARPFGVLPGSHDWHPPLDVRDDRAAAAAARWTALGARGMRVMVNLSAGHPDRCWVEDRWRRVLLRLRERVPDARFVILGMPEDQSMADRLAAVLKGASPPLGLHDAIATVASADFVITPDTAVSHMASAFRRPTLALMRAEQQRLVPYRVPGRNVFADNARYLSSLPVERVIAALDDYLDETIGRAGRAPASNPMPS